MGLKGRLGPPVMAPWWLKFAVKVATSTARLPYGVRVRLGIGRHGSMRDAAYVLSVVRHHLDAIESRSDGFTALELGPGDSTLSGLVAWALGARMTYLVDDGPYATYEPRRADDLLAHLRDAKLPVPFDSAPADHASFLTATNTVYLTQGLTSLRQVASGSVDAFWSHAVLEHVRRADLEPIIAEMRRVLAPNGVTSHRVDFLDHLSAGFNNLRMSSKVWERPAVWRSGAYTNRFAPSQFIDAFEASGFRVAVTEVRPRNVPDDIERRLAREFRNRSLDDLGTAGIDLVGRVVKA